MDSDSPLISIIIPCYNQGKYLSDCIQSIANSTYKNIEVIIVDDGSTSQETKICIYEVFNSFKAILRIKIIHKENGGLSSARNAGILSSTGKFIQLLDADDTIVAEKFQKQLLIFKDTPDLAVVISDYYFAPENLTYLKAANPSTILENSLDVISFLTKWERGLSIPIHCALFRREAFATVKFKSFVRAKEDWIFWTELSHALGHSRFHYHIDKMAIYRVHNSSMTQKAEAMLLEWIKAQTYLFSKFGNLLSDDCLIEEAEKSSLHIHNKYLLNIKHRKPRIIEFIKPILQKHPRIYLAICRIWDSIKEQLRRD